MNLRTLLTPGEADHLAVVRRPVIVVMLLSLLIGAGTLGFRYFRDSSWLESVYLAVVTLTTLGCRDPANNSTTMAFVVVYLGLGLGLFSYSLFTLGQSLLDPQFRQFWKQRRMLNRIDALNDHHIVCGFGRMGTTICEYLARKSKPFVVIDTDVEALEARCTPNNWLYIVGDATDDVHLHQAGIARATALASVLPSDADNTYVVLSARMLNNELQIVARASDDKAIEKIQRAGATRVISPFSSGGTKMARFMLNPSVESFVEVADEHDSDLELVDIQVSEGSPLIGQRLAETRLAERGVMVLAIRRSTGERLMPPPGPTEIQAGDNLFAFGHADKVATVIAECEGK